MNNMDIFPKSIIST